MNFRRVSFVSFSLPLFLPSARGFLLDSWPWYCKKHSFDWFLRERRRVGGVPVSSTEGSCGGVRVGSPNGSRESILLSKETQTTL